MTGPLLKRNHLVAIVFRVMTAMAVITFLFIIRVAKAPLIASELSPYTAILLGELLCRVKIMSS